MALDSIYRIRENKEIKETPQEEYNYQNSKSLLDTINDILDRQETGDLDQQWVKENEGKENSFSTPSPKSEEEQQIDDILATFKKIRESNNNMRSQMRKQQLTPLQQLQETKEWFDSMTGGKSR